jgi:hypothetical protein
MDSWKRVGLGSWLAEMLVRKPKTLVAIALANKMARILWAILKIRESYRVPAAACPDKLLENTGSERSAESVRENDR